MQTRLLRADQPGAIEEAAALLKKGLLVVFPTDTVYGVGADPFNPAAIERLYRAKERPTEKGIPVLLGDLADLNKIVRSITPEAKILVERYWPGPLTLVLPRSESLPAVLTPNEGIAVRIPDNEIARKLIRAVGGAVAASSANLSGGRPAPDAHEALTALSGSVAAVLDGGPVHYGQASTVLDCTVSPPRLLRRGPATDKTFPFAVVPTS
jgi:L-threonylcarbamoyladenylate synthase